MPLALYKALGKDPKKLKPTNTNLTAYGGNKIEVSGCCYLKSRYRNSVRVLEFYVVNACAPCALSLKACQDLALIKVVLAVYTENKSQTDKLLDEFKDVFIGQGCVQRIIDFNYVPNPVWSVSLFTNAFRNLLRSGSVSEEDE